MIEVARWEGRLRRVAVGAAMGSGLRRSAALGPLRRKTSPATRVEVGIRLRRVAVGRVAGGSPRGDTADGPC